MSGRMCLKRLQIFKMHKSLNLADSIQEITALRIVRSWWSIQFSTSLLFAFRGRLSLPS